MIIEIKDLPSGQKIKDINVQISFEDGHTTLETDVSEHVHNKTEPIWQTTQEESKPEIPNEHLSESREVKEIPDEMKDMEF